MADLENIYKQCSKLNKIKIFNDGPKLVEKELKTALSDLSSAKESYDRNGFKWATIQSYYSMFHSARALLYSLKYRERSHICLISAINEFFVKTNKIDKIFIKDLLSAKELRENADYENEFDEKSSKLLLESAENFLNKVKEVLK